MRTIGKAGASAFWKKYFLSPVGMANFAIVSKETNKVIGFTSPDQWRQS